MAVLFVVLAGNEMLGHSWGHATKTPESTYRVLWRPEQVHELADYDPRLVKVVRLRTFDWHDWADGALLEVAEMGFQVIEPAGSNSVSAQKKAAPIKELRDS